MVTDDPHGPGPADRQSLLAWAQDQNSAGSFWTAPHDNLTYHISDLDGDGVALHITEALPDSASGFVQELSAFKVFDTVDEAMGAAELHCSEYLKQPVLGGT